MSVLKSILALLALSFAINGFAAERSGEYSRNRLRDSERERERAELRKPTTPELSLNGKPFRIFVGRNNYMLVLVQNRSAAKGFDVYGGHAEMIFKNEVLFDGVNRFTLSGSGHVRGTVLENGRAILLYTSQSGNFNGSTVLDELKETTENDINTTKIRVGHSSLASLLYQFRSSRLRVSYASKSEAVWVCKKLYEL